MELTFKDNTAADLQDRACSKYSVIAEHDG